MNELTLFDRQSEIISQIHHEGDMVSLTDLWKEAGANKDKTPNDWMNIEANKQLIETVAGMLNTAHNGKSDIQVVRTKRGAQSTGGGTWAHKQIAKSLGYSENTAMSVATSFVPNEWKGVYPINTPYGNQELTRQRR